MISISYISSAKQRPGQDELIALLAQCHENNHALDITGLLLYNGKGTYIQLLEGEATGVDGLFSKIKSDARHHSVLRLSRRNIEQRSFPCWKMGFRNLKSESVSNLKGYSDFMERDSSDVFWGENLSIVDALIYHFKGRSQELVFNQ